MADAKRRKLSELERFRRKVPHVSSVPPRPAIARFCCRRRVNVRNPYLSSRGAGTIKLACRADVLLLPSPFLIFIPLPSPALPSPHPSSRFPIFCCFLIIRHPPPALALETSVPVSSPIILHDTSRSASDRIVVNPSYRPDFPPIPASLLTCSMFLLYNWTSRTRASWCRRPFLLQGEPSSWRRTSRRSRTSLQASYSDAWHASTKDLGRRQRQAWSPGGSQAFSRG